MKTLKLLSMLALSLLTVACEVELCEEPQHPHFAGVKYEFDWSELDANGVKHPKDMGVINYRVVNHRKDLCRVESETGKGTFMRVEDSTLIQRVSSGQLDTIPVTQGEWRFMTFAYDSTGVDIKDIFRFVKAEPLDMSMGDIGIEYKTYPMNSPELGIPLSDWDDYNGYALFMKTDLDGIMVDTTDVMTVATDEVKTVTLKPHVVSQKVDVYFTMAKKQKAGERFMIDSVWAEISGVSRRISLSTGKLDVSRTGKMMFPMDLWKGEVGTGTPTGDAFDNNGKVRCHQTFNVSGIVPPSESHDGAGDQASRDYGPGIMQVVIFTTSEQTDESGQALHKRFQGKVNLYNALRRSPSIVYSEDFSYAVRNGDHCVIDINADVIIDGSKILSHPNADGGINPWDVWQFGDSGSGDIIIEI